MISSAGSSTLSKIGQAQRIAAVHLERTEQLPASARKRAGITLLVSAFVAGQIGQELLLALLHKPQAAGRSLAAIANFQSDAALRPARKKPAR